MSNLGRIVLVLICLVQLPKILAQNNTNSPYSRFGIGELSRAGYDKSRAMGKLGLALRDNNQLNMLNPASYTALDTLSFMFDFGLNGRLSVYETRDLSHLSYNINIDHISIGFPFTRWWKSSIGIMPYSSVGYNIKEEDFIKNSGAVDYLYAGNGGLNKFYLGTAMEFFHRLSLGVNFSYIFGALDIEKKVDFPLNPEYSSIIVENRTMVNGFIYNFGLQYQETFAGDFTFTLGCIFDNERSIGAEKTVTIRNIFPGNTAKINDSIVLNPAFVLEQDISKGNILIPSNLGGGFSFRYKDKLLLGLDYYKQDWTGSSAPGELDVYAKSSSYHAGVEVTPDNKTLREYWKRMHYRLGGYYENSYLQFRGHQLNDSGISFGLGLPFKGDKTSFNLACNIGNRGTLDNNLIHEKYLFLSFSITLHDFWFYKRKYE